MKRFHCAVAGALFVAAAFARAPAAAESHLTVDDIIHMESASAAELSPDGRWAVWVKSVANREKNKRNLHIYLSATREDLTVQITRGDVEDNSPQFSPDGRRIAFLGTRGEKSKSQIYVVGLRGGEPEQITKAESGVNAFAWLGDGSIVFSAREDSTLRERTLTEAKDDVIVVADRDHYPPVRLFRVDIEPRKTTRLTTNAGQVTEFSPSPDRRWIVTSENQDVDFEYDYRIPPKQFLLNAETMERREIFASPYVDPYDFQWDSAGEGFFCRRSVASDSTDTYVSISHLYYFDVSTERLTPVSLGWKNGLGRSYRVVADGVVVELAGGVTDRVAHVTLGDGAPVVRAIETEKPIRLLAASRDEKLVVYLSSDASTIPELMTGAVGNAGIEDARRLAPLNEPLRKKTLVPSAVLRWAGAKGDTVEGVLHFPAGYDSARVYPLVALIHGGPAGVDRNFFTEGWSEYPNVLAAKGTFVLRVNYHGSGNYGLDWVESIKGHYYEYEVPDILTGVDNLIERGMVDGNRLGIMGWSNGSILAIACCLETGRFKVLCAGAGDVNWTSDYGNCAFGAAFDNAYFGGPPWENPQIYIDKSPFFRIHELETPTLIMFGTADTNVPTEQGWQLFRAMRLAGAAPVRFLLFPGATHSLRKLSHQKRKMEEELAWFDTHLFGTAQPKNEALDADAPLALALRKNGVKRVGYLIGEELEESIVPEMFEFAGLRVSRFEVTRAQFGAFDPNYTYPAGTDNHPANAISLPLAQAYCLWLSEKTGRKLRLPTAEEMDRLLAAAESNFPHENNLAYWLGYEPTPDEAALVEEKLDELASSRLLLEPVGSFRPATEPGAAGAGGVYDLGGNAAEWVTDEKGNGAVKGLSAISPRDPREPYRMPPLAYVGFRVVETR